MNNPFKGNFLRNVLKVVGGAAAGQLILLIASPFITRLFGPEAFGVWGVFSSVALVIIPVASLCYVTAIVLPTRDEDAQTLAELSLMIATVIAFLTALFFVFLGSSTDRIFPGVGDAWALFPLLGLFVFVGAWGEISRQNLIRQQRFNSLSMVTTSTSALTASAQVIGGFILPTPATLIASNSLAKSLDAIVKWSFSRVPRGPGKRRRSTVSDYLRLARQYRTFPLFKAPQTLVDGLSKSVPTIALAFFFGPAAAGFFTICRMVLLVPTNLVGTAISDVFYPRVVRSYSRNEGIFSPTFKATLLSLAIGTIPLVIVVFWGPALFSMVFGAEWRMAGHYAQWLSIWTWAMFLNRPAVQVIQVLALHRVHLRFTIVNTVVRLSVMCGLAYSTGDQLMAIAGYSLVALVSNLVLVAWVLLRCRDADIGGA